MSTAALTVRNREEKQNYEKVYAWLREQAAQLGLTITLVPEDARLEGQWLYLPVFIANAVDSYDNALKLQKLEETWNDQEPKQEYSVFLVPTKNPLRRAAMERQADAMQRKVQAITAFGKAATREDQEKAAAEFHAAEQAEQEAQNAYEQILPWNERAA
ncbi:MAG: hypothetical protein ACRYFS_09530 [Janthinobacterium lividum]